MIAIMPGSLDHTNPRAEKMSNYFVYRSGVSANDTGPEAVTEEINLSGAISASENKILVILRRTAGSGGASVRLYHLPPHRQTDVYDGVGPVMEATPVEADERLVVDKLLAGRYKILLTEIDGGTFDIIVSHTQETMNWDNS